MWGDLYQEFLFGAIGTGVAIGDYDGDGRPDLFVVSKTESCRLFRNLGDWKFEEVTEKAGVADPGDAARVWKQGATFVDVNNDGWLDLYVCRFNAPNLLYVNQHDGTFKESAHAYGLDVKDGSAMASFCDYDRDGWLDVYLAVNTSDYARHPTGQRGYLFHNNRDGTFTDVTVRAGISGETQTHSATWWDYDNDGWPDLYVANDYGAGDPLYHNNHDGTFTNVLDRVVPHTTFSSMGSDVGDVNNDGRIDFFVADMAATNHQKDQRSIADARGRGAELADDPTNFPKYHRNALFLNTGAGRCLEASCLAGLAATDWTWSVRFEDLDCDGRLDLFVTNGMRVEQNVDVTNRMMAAESTAERVRIMRDSPPLVEAHLAFRNLGDLQFESVGPAWGLDHKGISFGAAFGDLDGDGDLDLVYSNYRDGVTVLRNDGVAGHALVVDLHGTQSNRFGVGATVKIETDSGVQVRQLWSARGYLSSSEPMVHFGLGGETRVRRLSVVWPSGVEQTFDDVQADQRLTITEPASAAKRRDADSSRVAGQFEDVSHEMGLEMRSREDTVDELAQRRLLPARFNRRGPALAVSPIDGTRANETICIGGTTLDPLRLLDKTSTAFAEMKRATPPSSLVNDGPILFFDANADGLNDLLITRGGSALQDGSAEYEPTLLLNDGHGGFQPAAHGMLPSLPISVGAVAAADFNRDGKLDVFIGGRISPGQYPETPKSALLANQGGRFEDATETLASGLSRVGMVTGALWSDVDRDGWPDLLVTIEWGNVKYFHNEQGKRFDDWTAKAGFASAGTGWWSGIAAADFNGDGQLDYVAGNVGLNTQYHADDAHPALLFSGDFKGDGIPVLVEGYYEGDKLYPWRTRRDLGAAIPSILKRFPRNDAYARATLSEIVGEKSLASARKFAATELRSGVFLSQADGTYRFAPLPRLAQIAPLQGIVAGDFDGDGNADIYAVQNSYAPNPVVGRFDGGLSQLLRGDGRGNFIAASVAETRLIVPGDAKALVTLDLDDDGWPDFLASRNNSTPLAFRNHGVAGRHSLRVVLRGAAGNPGAIGARVTARYANGSTQTAEIAAGSGYYSQSTASCFFGSPGSNPLQSIDVFWPTGVATHHDVPAAIHVLALTSP
jgi:hypothetical protein